MAKFYYQEAVDAGYSPEEIDAFIKQTPGVEVVGAGAGATPEGSLGSDDFDVSGIQPSPERGFLGNMLSSIAHIPGQLVSNIGATAKLLETGINEGVGAANTAYDQGKFDAPFNLGPLGTYTPRDVSKEGGYGKSTLKSAGQGLEGALTFAGGGLGTLSKGLATIGKGAMGAGAKGVGRGILKNAAEGAAYGAGYGLSEAMQKQEGIGHGVLDVILGTATGAVLQPIASPVLGGVGKVGGKLFRNVKQEGITGGAFKTLDQGFNAFGRKLDSMRGIDKTASPAIPEKFGIKNYEDAVKTFETLDLSKENISDEELTKAIAAKYKLSSDLDAVVKEHAGATGVKTMQDLEKETGMKVGDFIIDDQIPIGMDKEGYYHVDLKAFDNLSHKANEQFSKQLASTGATVSLTNVERDAIKGLTSVGTKLEQDQTAIRKEIGALRKQYGTNDIPADVANTLKSKKWAQSRFNAKTGESGNEWNESVGHALKDNIENSIKGDIPLTNELKYLQAREITANLLSKVVGNLPKNSQTTKMAMRVLGFLGGAKGGPAGMFAGMKAGENFAKVANNPNFRTFFSRMKYEKGAKIPVRGSESFNAFVEKEMAAREAQQTKQFAETAEGLTERELGFSEDEISMALQELYENQLTAKNLAPETLDAVAMDLRNNMQNGKRTVSKDVLDRIADDINTGIDATAKTAAASGEKVMKLGTTISEMTKSSKTPETITALLKRNGVPEDLAQEYGFRLSTSSKTGVSKLLKELGQELPDDLPTIDFEAPPIAENLP